MSYDTKLAFVMGNVVRDLITEYDLPKDEALGFATRRFNERMKTELEDEEMSPLQKKSGDE